MSVNKIVNETLALESMPEVLEELSELELKLIFFVRLLDDRDKNSILRFAEVMALLAS